MTGTISQPNPPCENVIWTVNGYSTGPGSFYLTDTGPSSACGRPVDFPTLSVNVQVTCASAAVTPAGSSSSTALAPLAATPYTAWTRIATTTPGITLTARLSTGLVYANLIGDKTDVLAVTLTPSAPGGGLPVTPSVFVRVDRLGRRCDRAGF